MLYRIILRNILWMLLERSSQIVAGIIVSGLLARGLGAAQFGLFQYSQSLVFLASAITLLCSAEVVLPRLVDKTEVVRQHVMVHALVLRIGAAIVTYALLAIYALFVSEPILRGVILWLGIALLLREPFGVITTWLQIKNFNRPSVQANLIALAIKVLLITILYFLKASLVAFSVVYAIEALIAAAILVIYYRWQIPVHRISWNPTLLRELLHSGMTFWAGLLLMFFFKRIDQLVLKLVIPLSELGTYVAAMQITENFVLVAPIIANSLATPFFLQVKDTIVARRNAWKATVIIVTSGTCLAVPIALFSPSIIHLIYGPAFTEAAKILRISALLGILVFADAALNLSLVRRGEGHWIIAKWLSASGAAFATVTSLAPHLGALAGLAGYGVGYVVAIAVGVWLTGRDQ
ncbi:oligosaccharide flippase family protein [Candidatus Pandoraea novymonadis]|uniref:Lipopolysaccharide biosynthesis protein n=1 Tax=Candidatus Pandoraea novymonadis TaxID=1808959 RepID=A0ABX5FF62_9BURK|nr:oligosaccharide flippase family protein [Candidatus Pandoraea novymonadis]PSB92345.1 hypothetical protein BZL35_00585 [Candidatus Pandoraea novymonadis]